MRDEKKLSRKPADAQARREVYYAKRREGLGMWDAGLAAGLEAPSTIQLYERWWKKIGKKDGEET